MQPFPSNLFTACLDLLTGRSPDQAAGAAAQCFLQDLGYLDQSGRVSDQDTLVARSRLLTVAAKLDLFPLKVPDAPRALFIGGRAEPGRFSAQHRYPAASLSGIGLSLADAFEACVGEAVEYISQLAHGDEAALDSLPATALTGGAECLVPVGRCLRRADAAAQAGLSSGCAAGATKTQALIHALLELVERDAAALWWSGGRIPRPLPLETVAMAGVGTFFQRVGRDTAVRHSALLDITTDIGIPCIAAVSARRSDGRYFACGLSAHMDPRQAIGKALLEMLQMELSHHVLAAKRAAVGDERLNEHDLNQLMRAEASNLWESPLLRPSGLAGAGLWPKQDRPDVLATILDKLTERGFTAYAIDLSRDYIGLPVVKVLIPGLQPNPSSLTSQRLKAVIERTGGGERYTKGISLL